MLGAAFQTCTPDAAASGDARTGWTLQYGGACGRFGQSQCDRMAPTC